jgi:hypothetical protein
MALAGKHIRDVSSGGDREVERRQTEPTFQLAMLTNSSHSGLHSFLGNFTSKYLKKWPTKKRRERFLGPERGSAR